MSPGVSGVAHERSMRWEVVVHEGNGAMASAMAAWESCVRASPEALVFSRPAWAQAWLAVYGRRRRPCIVEVWSEGGPVAVFPLQTTVVPMLGLRRLEFVGGAPPTWRQWLLNPDGLGQAIYAGGVIVPGHEEAAVGGLRQWLDDGAARWDMLQFNCVEADSPLGRELWPLGPGWRCRETAQLKHRINLAEGWEAWTATISKRQRRHLNYEPHALTRAAGAALELDEVRGAGVAAAMEEYLALNRLRWAARRRPGVPAGDVALYRRLAADAGSGMVFYRLTAGGRLLACQFGFDHGGRYLIYGLTFDASFERQSPSQVLMQMVIRRCFDDGHREVDLGALRAVDQWTRQTRRRVHLTAQSRRPVSQVRAAALAQAGQAVRGAQESPFGRRLRAGVARLVARRFEGAAAPPGVAVDDGGRAARRAKVDRPKVDRPSPPRDLDKARVTVVVPTHNSARTLGPCLQSLRRQSEPCRIVVVDNFSTDGTAELAASFADEVVTAGPERSTQRNIGARRATTPFIGFIDSDMVVSDGVVEEAARALGETVGAVIVPERSVGSGFWAQVRQFERSFYPGSATVEAARFFRQNVFEATGGFDDSFTGGEDWDLHLRATKLTTVGRTVSGIDHDESGLRFVESCAKKAYYAAGLRVFAAKHGTDALTAAVFDRPYLRRPWRLLYPHPVLGAGLIALKAGELGGVVAGLVRTRSR